MAPPLCRLALLLASLAAGPARAADSGDLGALRVIIAAHYDDSPIGAAQHADKIIRLQAHGWRAVQHDAELLVVGNEPEGSREAADLEEICAKHGVDFQLNPGYPERGFELGAYAVGVEWLESKGASDDDTAVFIQDSFIPHEQDMASFPQAVAAKGGDRRPVCLRTFFKTAGVDPGALSPGGNRYDTISKWVGQLQGDRFGRGFQLDSPWHGCGVNSFVSKVRYVKELREANFFEPHVTTHFDCQTEERYIGYVFSHMYGIQDHGGMCESPPDCGLRKFLLMRNFSHPHPSMKRDYSFFGPDARRILRQKS